MTRTTKAGYSNLVPDFNFAVITVTLDGRTVVERFAIGRQNAENALAIARQKYPKLGFAIVEVYRDDDFLLRLAGTGQLALRN